MKGLLIMQNNIIYTIGYTKRTARSFFNSLKDARVKLLIDIRLNNTSQLAGYAKKENLTFFLKEICSCEYLYLPECAPSKNILDNYQSNMIDWQMYESQFVALLETRKPILKIKNINIDHSCLLCAEPTPENCHRKLVAEYIKLYIPGTTIQHL